MDSKVKCTCGWSWNKSDSSKKDMYVCHQCGKDNTMKNGGWLDKFQDGGEKTYGTYQLPEVIVTPEPEKEGFWKQSIKDYLDENKDAGFLGALGSVATYPLGLPQQAMMYGLTGKVQRPSEAMEIKNPLGALATDVIADPLNLVGVGVADDALKLSDKINKLFKEQKLLSKANKSKILIPNANKSKIKNYLSSIKNNDDKIYHHLDMGEQGNAYTKILPSKSDYNKWADEIYPGLSELISPDQLKAAHEKSIDYFKNSAVTGAGGKEHGLFIRNLFSDIIPQFRFPVVQNPEGYQVSQYISTSMDEAGNLTKTTDFINSDPLIQDLLTKSGYDTSKLTPQDWNIIDAYTKGYDNSINSLLRGKNRLGLPIEGTKKFYTAQADLLKESVLKNKSKEPFQVTRGVGNYYVELLDPKTYQPLNKRVTRSELQKGDVFKDESFLSTGLVTENSPVFGNYQSSELIDIPGGNVQSIAIPEASSYPQFPGEREVILPPGLIRRVEEENLSGNVRFRTSILNPYSLTGLLGGTAAASSNLKQKKNGGWLSKFDVPEAENGIEGTMGGLTDKGFDYNGAWGGTMAMGGSLPGSVGFTYARTQDPAPSKGKYAKKTMASAQNGQEMKFYQEGLDWKPKNISRDGSIIEDDLGQWAHPGEITKINSNQITMRGVDIPLLGISDTGDTQMMYPGQDYTYEGESVTEIPMAQGGRVIRKNTRDTNVLEDATKWYQDNTKDKDWLEITDDILSAPQRAATYAITGALTGDPKYINPSDALNIQNKWGKLATDIVLDPTNLLGIGLASKLGKIAKGAKTIEKTKTVFNKPVAEAMSTLLKTPAGVSARGFLGGRKFSSAAKPFWKEYDKLLAQVWKKETVTEALKLGAKDGIGSVAIINDLIQKYPSKKEEILNITNTSLLKKDNNLLLKNKKELGNKPKIIENKSSIKNSNQKITYKENPESISSLTMLNKPETKKDVKPDNTMVQLMPFGLVPKYKVDSLNNIGYKRAIGNSYINSGGMETYGPDSSDAIKKGLNLPSTKGKQKNGGWLSKYN